MGSTIKQRLRRFNGTDYDSIYLSANVGDVVGTLDVVNGGTGNSSVDTTPTSGSTKMCTSGGIYTEINTLKTSVSEGKAAIASAITDKGVSTASDASFSTMATNIRNVSFDFSGANITRDDLEYGKYGWDANGKLITGWREGSVTLQPTSLTLNINNPTRTITVTRPGDGAISASSSDTSVATVSVNGTTVTVSSVNETSGSATVTVNVAQGTDYKAASATCAVTASFGPLNTDSPSLGETVYFTAYPSITWQVQHLDGNYAYLALYPMTVTSSFGADAHYYDSTIASKCTTFLNNTIPNVADYLESVSVEHITNKVFIPSRSMYESQWDWPKAGRSNRICQLNGSNTDYWTSSIESGESLAYVVGNNGSFFSNDLSLKCGFRPAVKVRYKA